jgi:hypothetical protein
LPGEPLEEGGGALDLVAGVAAAGRGDRLFSARARSRGRTRQVAKRRMIWAWPSSVMLARCPGSHRSSEQAIARDPQPARRGRS